MGRIILPQIKPYYVATIIQTEGEVHTPVQHSAVENPGIDTYICPTNFEKRVKAILWR